MAKSTNQKGKLLALLEILKEKSDEAHPISLSEIKEHLSAYGISAERKSLYDDMETLRAFGYDIVSVKNKTTGYYLGSRLFELAELKLLADAVESSRFITRKKSDELIGKLSAEISEYDAHALRREVHVAGRVKTMNESIYYNVDLIHSAIREDKKVRFLYFGWNAQKEKVLRHDGAFYEISPFALTWDDENYYLIAYDTAAGKIKHYRVDKMLRLSASENKRDGESVFRNFNLAEYAASVFGMYGGQREDVTLLVANALAGVIIDRFGTDITFFPAEDGFFTVHLRISVSPTFLSWVLGFGKDMRILSPLSVKKQLLALAEETLLSYRD